MEFQNGRGLFGALKNLESEYRFVFFRQVVNESRVTFQRDLQRRSLWNYMLASYGKA